MKKIINIINGINISWKFIIIISVVSGIITGIIPLIPFLNHTSIHNIAECFEIWVLLAMIIILNCKTPKDAAIKVFVFFLISQPLCYLIQVPFYETHFEIFKYYKYWFSLTILTLPVGYIMWYIKKENILSMILISIVNFLLSIELINHFNTLIKSFPYQVLAVLFILLEILLLIKMNFKENKKIKIMYILTIVILLLSILILNVNNIKNEKNRKIFSVIQLENNTYKVQKAPNEIQVEINNEFVTISGNKEGTYIIKLIDSNNKTIELEYIVENQNGYINILNK